MYFDWKFDLQINGSLHTRSSCYIAGVPESIVDRGLGTTPKVIEACVGLMWLVLDSHRIELQGCRTSRRFFQDYFDIVSAVSQNKLTSVYLILRARSERFGLCRTRMSSPAIMRLPTESWIHIFSEAIEPIVDAEGEFCSGRCLRGPVCKRLISFRNIARVCKAWLDPSRTVFWTDVAVGTWNLELLALSVEGPASKASCIQRLLLGPESSQRTDNIRKYLPVLLSRLPGRLKVVQIAQPGQYYAPRVRSAFEEIAIIMETKATGIHYTEKLVLPGMYSDNEIAHALGSFRGISHLHLPLSALTQTSKYSDSLACLTLTSLYLDVDFSCLYGRNQAIQATSAAARNIASAMQPACKQLQHFAIFFKTYHPDTPDVVHTDTFRWLHSIGAPTVQRLSMKASAHPLHDRNGFGIHDFASSEDFAEFPRLETLSLDGCSFSSDAILQMGSFKLKTLNIRLDWPLKEGESNERLHILAALRQPQLGALRDLKISFKEAYIFEYREDNWDKMGMTWAVVEDECLARGIRCKIKYPEERAADRMMEQMD